MTDLTADIPLLSAIAAFRNARTKEQNLAERGFARRLAKLVEIAEASEDDEIKLKIAPVTVNEYDHRYVMNKSGRRTHSTNHGAYFRTINNKKYIAYKTKWSAATLSTYSAAGIRFAITTMEPHEYYLFVFEDDTEKARTIDRTILDFV